MRKPPPKVAPVLASPKSESDDEAESLADLMGSAPQVGLRKTKKPSAKLNSVTDKLGVEMTGSFQGGRYPSDASTHAHLPSELDYGGQRSRQILHHFSEVLKWRLEENKLAPVEVQAQYLKQGGQFHLAVSANQKQSQEFLQKMSGEDLANMYSAAMRKDAPERVRKSAAKLLHIKAQNEQRLKAETEENPEDKEDLADAETLSALMRDRDKFSVAMNPWGRHAEQNLNKAFTDAFGKEDGDKTDVAGTLIRCGACSAALGVDKTLSALLTSNGHKVKDVAGKFYPSQADVEDWKPLFKDIVAGNTFVEHGNSKRRSSMSPAAYLARPEPKEGKAIEGKVLKFPDSPYMAQKKKGAAKKGDGGKY